MSWFDEIFGHGIKKTRWFHPYTTNKQGTRVPTMKGDWKEGAGVYFIRNAQSEKIIYIGSSTSQLKATIYRHFQTWTDRQDKNNRQFERTTYGKGDQWEIRFITCTPTQATRAEMYLIRKHQPRDNPIKYHNLGPEEIEAGRKVVEKIAAAPTLKKEEFTIYPF